MRSVLLAWPLLWAAMVALPPIATSAIAAQPQGNEATDSSAAQPAAPAVVPAPIEVSKPEISPTQTMTVDDVERRAAIHKLMLVLGTRATDRKEDQTAIEAFYKQRDFQPLWTAGGTPTQQAMAAVAQLKSAVTLGLDPADYPTPDLPGFLNADAVALAEIKLTNSILTFVRHVSSGRISYTRVSGSILYPAEPFDPATILAQLASSKDIDATLSGFEPPQSGYKALKVKLARELAKPSAPKLGKIGSADLIVANIERWRWMPRDLGTSHVIVNIPQYSLQVMDRGKPVWATRIVVGKPGDMATPLLSETIKYLTVNPTWNVPPSIIRNEYLPAFQRDSGALERVGLKIGRNHDGSVRVYQPPGPKNALGRIRFNFPNPFLVYQHDTPNKNLFAHDKRALSHGCMRVQYPEKYAEALLAISQPKEGMTAARIRDLYGDDERTINLKRPIPVHITYQTALVDENGALVTSEDIYGLDAAVLKLMRGPERAVADRSIPRNYESSSKPVLARLPKSIGEGGDERRRAFVQPSAAAFYDRAVGTW